MLNNLLAEGIKKLDLTIAPEIQDKLITYVELLQKWNKVHNLTAISDDKEIVIKHILDSLAIVPFIKGSFALDFGSGAGLPGIPLALIAPQIKFVLLDSNIKKIAFLNHVILTLQIANAGTTHSRVEKFQFTEGFDCIITRATGSLHDIILLTKHLLAKNGQILVMKGKYPESEIAESNKIAYVSAHKLQIPYLDAERHLICMTLL